MAGIHFQAVNVVVILAPVGIMNLTTALIMVMVRNILIWDDVMDVPVEVVIVMILILLSLVIVMNHITVNIIAATMAMAVIAAGLALHIVLALRLITVISLVVMAMADVPMVAAVVVAVIVRNMLALAIVLGIVATVDRWSVMLVDTVHILVGLIAIAINQECVDGVIAIHMVDVPMVASDENLRFIH